MDEVFHRVKQLSCIVAMTAALGGSIAYAEGHGPVFALATPTLGKGQWSSDTSVMTLATVEGTSFVFREMIGYGIHEDLQAILAVPLGRSGDRLVNAPRMRAGAMMGSGLDVEASLLWRFDRKAPAIGTRRESTLIAGAAAPTEGRRAGTRIGPSMHLGAVTGYASREAYWWLGGGYQHYFQEGEDQLGSLTHLSATFAWRPPAFQQDYPKPDWRIFIESVAEHAENNTINGIENSDSGGDKLLAGLSVLGLFGPWGISAGFLLPVIEDLNDTQNSSEERVRAKAVVTYWF